MHGLFVMCSDSELDKFEDSESLTQELLERIRNSHMKTNILNRVYSYLHGLEPIETRKLEEYVPEEADWILNGRIKWLKRYDKIYSYNSTQIK